MHQIMRRLAVLIPIGAVFSCALSFGVQQDPDPIPDGALLSAWLEQEEVQQIPWKVSILPLTLRLDLQVELRVDAVVSIEELQKRGAKHDLVLFARVFERGRPLTPIHWGTPDVDNRPIFRSPADIRMVLTAIVQPGKYKMELGLVDRVTGRYSTRYEDISVEGKEDPLTRPFQRFSKFEFIGPRKKERPLTPLPGPFRPVPLGFRGLFPLPAARTADSPSFVVDRPGVTRLSVISVLSPPEKVIGQADHERVFRETLASILSVFSRLGVVRGTADFTGVDLMNRKRVFHRQDMKEITPELLDAALKIDTNTVPLTALADTGERGSFLRDVLKERFEEAEKDTSGAHHAIIVVGARSTFPNGSSLLPIPRSKNCRCQVFYSRFTVGRSEADDVDNLISAFKPPIFETLSWLEVRDAFGKIYEQLHR
jgi:hypothetical protein